MKSSSIKSSVTSQKYSCPGSEQNQDIHVDDEVGVDDAVEIVPVSDVSILSIGVHAWRESSRALKVQSIGREAKARHPVLPFIEHLAQVEQHTEGAMH